MFEVIPSPGTEDKDFSETEEKIKVIKSFAQTIHIDVIDGKFADNTTFLDPTPFAKYTKAPPTGKAGLFFEAHLMVEEPIKYLESFAAAGFRRFIGQIEKMSDQTEFVAKGQELGEVGLGLDKETSIDAIKVPFNDLDCVLVMTIKAGFSGQTFVEDLVEKIKILSSKVLIPVEVDGGINDRTIALAKDAGASRFVATSFIFGPKVNPLFQYQALEKTLKQ